jgi:uncharacterized protein YidB (DUF937 family)
MGLLESVLGAFLGGNQGAQGGGQNPQAMMLQAVLGMLLSGQQGGGGMGGLGGLMSALRQGGLGGQLDSWISTGPNQAVSPQDLQGALGGSDLLSNLARQFGGSQGDAASVLSQVLPGLIDQMTPRGQAPEFDTEGTPTNLDTDNLDFGSLLGQLTPK